MRRARSPKRARRSSVESPTENVNPAMPHMRDALQAAFPMSRFRSTNAHTLASESRLSGMSSVSAMVMPPYKVSAYHLAIIRDETERIALALGVKGLMNIQYAIKDDVVYVLEVNPRSSRTV